MIVDKACFERGCACYDDRVDGPGVEVVAREWRGLTDEEVENYYDWADFQVGCGRKTVFDMVKHIAQTLKEKNQ